MAFSMLAKESKIAIQYLIFWVLNENRKPRACVS
jgi:hypothetical protein